MKWDSRWEWRRGGEVFGIYPWAVSWMMASPLAARGYLITTQGNGHMHTHTHMPTHSHKQTWAWPDGFTLLFFFAVVVVIVFIDCTRTRSVFCLHHWHNAGNHSIPLDSDGLPVTRQCPTHQIEVEWLLVTQPAKCRQRSYHLIKKHNLGERQR